jgi:hypothetical protein
VKNKTEIMQHVLKMQLPKHTKEILGVLVYVRSHKQIQVY